MVQFCAWLNKGADIVSVDIESAGLNYQDPILSVAFCQTPGKAYIVEDTTLKDPMYAKMLGWALSSRHTRFIYHNGKFDCKLLRAQLPNCLAHVDMDTMLAHYCLDERRGTHGLKQLAILKCGAPDYEKELKKYLPNKDTSYAVIPRPVLYKYQACDVHYTRELADILLDEMRERYPEMESGLFKFLLRASAALLEVELNGNVIDKQRLASLQKEYGDKLKDLKEQLRVGAKPVLEEV
jgi:DNA polymerase I-like protein with 3'-5' exonuclease and polymerase domains